MTSAPASFDKPRASGCPSVRVEPVEALMDVGSILDRRRDHVPFSTSPILTLAILGVLVAGVVVLGRRKRATLRSVVVADRPSTSRPDGR